jgi:hypothetical protein
MGKQGKGESRGTIKQTNSTKRQHSMETAEKKNIKPKTVGMQRTND